MEFSVRDISESDVNWFGYGSNSLRRRRCCSFFSDILRRIPFYVMNEIFPNLMRAVGICHISVDGGLKYLVQQS